VSAPPAAPAGRPPGAVDLRLRLPFRPPLDLPALLRFLARRAVPGVESVAPGVYRRSLDLPHGAGAVALAAPRPTGTGPPPDGSGGYVDCRLLLQDERDAAPAVQRCRRLLDLDADPLPVAAHLVGDPDLAPLVLRSPGRRVPGHVDGAELALRAVLGQQVTVAGGRALAARLVALHGRPLGPLAGALPGVTHLFPRAGAVAEAGLEALPVPRARRAALRALARALAGGGLRLDPAADRVAVARALLALPGIGPWTVAYIAMRALGDGDAFLPADAALRRAAAGRGWACDPRRLSHRAERWRPWRAYATQHLWASLGESGDEQTSPGRSAAGG